MKCKLQWAWQALLVGFDLFRSDHLKEHIPFVELQAKPAPRDADAFQMLLPICCSLLRRIEHGKLVVTRDV